MLENFCFLFLGVDFATGDILCDVFLSYIGVESSDTPVPSRLETEGEVCGRSG